MYLGPVPLCLSARAACGGVPFTGSRGVSSGPCYQVITDANAAWETCRPRGKRGAARRGLAVPAEGSLFPGSCACSVQRGDMAPPAFGEPPETTSSTCNYWGMRGILHPGKKKEVWEGRVCWGTLTEIFPKISDIHLDVKYAQTCILSMAILERETHQSPFFSE